MLIEEIPEPYRQSVVRLAEGLLTLGGYRYNTQGERCSRHDAVTDAHALLIHWLLGLPDRGAHPREPTLIDLREPHASEVGRTRSW